MPAEPDALRRLKALGLDQKTIAQFLGASPASVSAWCNGKTPFEDPWLTEATILIAVLQEHLTHGGTLATFRHVTGFVLEDDRLKTRFRLVVPEEQVGDVLKTQAAIRDLPTAAQDLAYFAAFVTLAGGVIGAWAESIDPLSWHPTARELDEMRRTIECLREMLTGQLRSLVEAAPTEANDADETA